MQFINHSVHSFVFLCVEFFIQRLTQPPFIGDRPVGAEGAAATPDKENNLSTRNQKLMKKKFQTRKSVHDA